MWNREKPQKVIETLSRKRNAEIFTILDLKLYPRAIVTKPAWYWHKSRNIVQYNKIEKPE